MLSSRPSIVCLLSALILQLNFPAANAQEADKKAEPAAKAVVAKKPEIPPVVKITIHPKAIEEKDIEKTLLPPYAEMSSGNAMLEYFRSLSSEYTSQRSWSREVEEKKLEWMAMPLDKMPKEEVRDASGRAALWIMKDGARKTYADMGYLERIKKGGANTLLGEMQSLRENLKNVRLYSRYLIAEKKYDDALDMIRTGFAAPRHLSQQPGNIIYLIAGASATQSIDSLHDWIAQPETSNLYWPLSQLPRPFLPTDKLMESELLLYDRVDDKHTAADLQRTMTENEAVVFFGNQVGIFISASVGYYEYPFIDEHMKDLKERLDAVNDFAEKLYPIAFESLQKAGRSESELKGMPKTQVCAIYHRWILTSQLRRCARWVQVEPWIAIREIAKERTVKTAIDGREIDSLPKFVIKNNTPDGFWNAGNHESVLSIKLGQARIENKLNVVSVIESLRDYAVDHPELPESLDALNRYPLNLTDHFTGKSIRYRRIDATTAVIETGPPEGMPGVDYYNQLRYEIRLAK
jgi:hypothetical protein